jgi:hypothetical protein
LEHLDADDNEVTVLPELPGLVSLDTLCLRHNPLRDLRGLEKLSYGSAQHIYLGSRP